MTIDWEKFGRAQDRKLRAVIHIPGVKEAIAALNWDGSDKGDIAMNIPNIHPADELAALREEIKQMQDRADTLRDALVAGSDADRDGKQYRAFIVKSTRETLDKEALIAALGREVVEPYLKKTEVKTLKVAMKDGEPVL